MGIISVQRQLSAPPAAVYAILTDPFTWPDWFTIHDRFVEEPPIDLHPGTRLASKVTLLDISVRVTWTVAELDEGARFALRGSAPAGVGCDFAYTLVPSDAGTAITAEGEFGGPLIMRSLSKALEKNGTIQLSRSLDLLESVAMLGRTGDRVG
ncbi:MAG TPA: SRPBCC family protein [Gordonia sp. (in: high G+C Gram-positive bacteria)]|uniref:type II toxin-antitoxin system Rv0910 family toxin n=1 Tax=unclassified Gordonia (in: high G+C Gram-positive bacteria) TaxID=2657482 RepID=UPI000FACAF2D|nr:MULTISPECIES: SRPBCC family protein [unclassified Gordonia (in: high G+C Gram-positive bacteria)]RUP37608.1 MAG: SRPBCC family protein [Gordonia sp. (in: high G+C Gram-positive bacteria)]HNP58501.1 SRPBCC family protein [Gordonia sp. (in: high G+C Gram-positive bacteria)]HRC51458.1 SRPBCC family protein [Gordonia sp. (in: high G+C Gram-positive bacteria)]